MTTASVTYDISEIKRSVRVKLSDAPAVSFRFAGHLAPVEGTVRTTTYDGRVSLSVDLTAKNDYNIEMRGTWGWPHSTEVPSHDYGHGGAGRITDLPAELLAALTVASGIDLVSLAETDTP